MERIFVVERQWTDEPPRFVRFADLDAALRAFRAIAPLNFASLKLYPEDDAPASYRHPQPNV